MRDRLGASAWIVFPLIIGENSGKGRGESDRTNPPCNSCLGYLRAADEEGVKALQEQRVEAGSIEGPGPFLPWRDTGSSEEAGTCTWLCWESKYCAYCSVPVGELIV